MNHRGGILDGHGGQGRVAQAAARGIAQLHLKTLVRVVHPIVQMTTGISLKVSSP
jgi:hypothetical protein